MDKTELLKTLTPSPFDLVKVLLTAVIILFATKLQLLSDKLSALLIALPLTSLLAMIWMHHDSSIEETSSRIDKIAGHAYYTFWFVLPTLPMFLLLPWMLRRGWGFYSSLATNCILTAALFWILAISLRPFGIRLF